MTRRTREEILNDSDNANSHNGIPSLSHGGRIMLEVFLDIRDLLEETLEKLDDVHTSVIEGNPR